MLLVDIKPILDKLDKTNRRLARVSRQLARIIELLELQNEETAKRNATPRSR